METGNRMLYALVIALATTVANGGLFMVHRLFEMDVLRLGRLRAIDIHPVERKPAGRQ